MTISVLERIRSIFSGQPIDCSPRLHFGSITTTDMTETSHPTLHLLSLTAALAASIIAIHPAAAQTAQPDTSQIIRLTPEQIAKLRDSATENTNGELLGGGFDRQIHGELGVMVGTNGARGAYGTAAIPLGQNAGAVISFEDSRYGRR